MSGVISKSPFSRLMSSLGPDPISMQEPRAAGLRVQTSAYGMTLPVVYGRNRIAGNLIWYGDFRSIAHTSTQSAGGKGGGGGMTTTSWTYRTSFALGLCEGPIHALHRAWRDKEILPSAFVGQPEPYSAQAIESHFVSAFATSFTLQRAGQFEKVVSISVPKTGGWMAERIYLRAGTHFTASNGVVYLLSAGHDYRSLSWKVTYQYTAEKIGSALFTAFLGTYSQTPWSYLDGKHPDEALSYPGIAYVVAADYDLGGQAALQNHNFDLTGRLPFNPAGEIFDANPKDIASDVLLNTDYAIGFQPERIGSLTKYSDYCLAAGLLLSPVYAEQRPAAEVIAELMRLTNSGVYFSEGLLKFVPFGDSALTGNGATYTPPAQAIYDLGPDDFLVEGDEDPIRAPRGNLADAFNQVQIEFCNRANDYNQEIVDPKDQAAIEAHGLRPAPVLRAHHITTPEVAGQVAQTLLQRSLHIRSTYEFVLGWRYCLLEPTDLLTLTEPELGFDKLPVRILSIEEDEDGRLQVVAEDYPAGVSSAAVYPQQIAAGYLMNFNQEPGPIVPPAFFESPALLTETGLRVGVAINGQNPGWGGCDVWVSYDGASYKRLTRIDGGARYGELVTSITSAAGQVADVLLAGDPGQILSSSSAEAAELATLCLIGDEYVAHTTATLVEEGCYSLTLTQRGAYSTEPVDHVAGAETFIRVDQAIAYSDSLELDRIGTTIHFKFCSFNAFGGGQQQLGDVEAYPYIITGVMAKLPPANVTGFAALASASGVSLTWDDVPDPDRLDFEVRLGASWDDGTRIAREATLGLRLPPLVAGAYTYWIKARDRLLNYSLAAASVTCNIGAPSAPAPAVAIDAADLVLTWPAPSSTFAIVEYEIRYGGSFATGISLGLAKSTVFRMPADYSGARTFWVAAVDAAGNVGAAGSASLTVNLAAAPVVTASLAGADFALRWDAPAASLPIVEYEIRHGASWASGASLGRVSATAFSAAATWQGGRNFWIAAYDSTGNVGAIGSVILTISAPAAPGVQMSIAGADYVVAWSAPTSSLPIVEYEIRQGASWDTGNPVARTKSTSFSGAVDWTGARTFWVAGVDSAGSVGAAGSAALTANGPGSVALAAALSGAAYALTWSAPTSSLPIKEYELRHGATWAGGVSLGRVSATSFSAVAAWSGSRTFWIAAYDVAGNAGTPSSVALTISSPTAISLSSSIAGTTATLTWSAPAASLPITEYEIRYGASWAAGTSLGRISGTSYAVDVAWLGARTFWVAAYDAAGNVGAANSAVVTVSAPAAPGLTAAVADGQYKLTWTAPTASLPIASYEVRYGATWAGGVSLGKLSALVFAAPVAWGGSRTFWVAATDALGNVGTAAQVTLNITAPTAPTVTYQVIDNNVLLYWTSAASTLAVDSYEIRKGATYGTSSLVGTKAGLFTTIFESAAGSYTYWVTGIDFAGNYGTPASVTASVNQPPDYVLKADIDSTFNGTLSNAILDLGAVVFPVNPTETFAQHFSTRSWASPQSQIDAGYPVYIQPGTLSGSYEEVVDYGTTLAASKITVTPTTEVVAGAPSFSTTISVKLNLGDAWTDYVASEIYATNFRYAKARITASGTATAIAKLTALNIRLDAKLKNDAGMASAVAGDVGGTTVAFNVPFIDITSITVTPQGTTRLTAVYDFVDVPNPTTFKVLIFDAAGNRASGTVSWSVKGY
jgi:Putative phage tail protein